MRLITRVSMCCSLLLFGMISVAEAKSYTPTRSVRSSSTHNKPGIYHFTDRKTGLPYIGKSIHTHTRIKQHLYKNKLSPKNLSTVKIEHYPRSTLKPVEKTKIRTLDILSSGKIANRQHAPLSRARMPNPKPYNQASKPKKK